MLSCSEILTAWELNNSAIEEILQHKKILIVLQMSMYQNNEGTRNFPKCVTTINFPNTPNFIFSHPLCFNVITECA
jgi:hypothetical protein